jgi:hypothetical protein
MNKTFGEALKEWLTEKYFGKKIYDYLRTTVFVVEHIEVMDTCDGLEISLLSNDRKVVDDRYLEWVCNKSDRGRVPVPIELESERCRVAFQCWFLHDTRSKLPEIVD